MRVSRRKSARLTPGSQAPHAPPALTFGPTSKQMVKPMRAGRDLIRLLSSLSENRKALPMSEVEHFQPIRSAVSKDSTYFRARRAAKVIWSLRKSAKSMPWALSAFGYSEALVRPGNVLVSRKTGPVSVMMKSERE
jgi:hypothetical protein